MPTLSTKRTMARAAGGQPTAKRLRTLERQVAQNKTELKFLTGTFSQVDAGNITGQILQNVTKGGRVGDTINIKKCTISCSLTSYERSRLVLYTPVDTQTGAAGIPLTKGQPYTQFIDTNEFKVWNDVQYLADIDIGDKPLALNKLMTATKTFSIPMKTKYREGDAGAYHNQMRWLLYHQDENGVLAGIEDDQGGIDPGRITMTYKIWYYDA